MMDGKYDQITGAGSATTSRLASDQLGLSAPGGHEPEVALSLQNLYGIAGRLEDLAQRLTSWQTHVLGPQPEPPPGSGAPNQPGEPGPDYDLGLNGTILRACDQLRTSCNTIERNLEKLELYI